MGEDGRRERGNQADTRLHAPRLRLNNKLELFILATLFATDRHLLQGLANGRGQRPSASTEVVENRRCAFFMIISSVACHVNFTYTSLYSFTAERGCQKGAWLGSLPCRTHTHTHVHTLRVGYGYYLSLENHPSSAPNCESNSESGVTLCPVLSWRTEVQTAIAILFYASIPC